MKLFRAIAFALCRRWLVEHRGTIALLTVAALLLGSGLGLGAAVVGFFL